MDAEAAGARSRTSLLEWFGRVVSLVLAGLVTLSIIGAIAAIPSGSIGTRIGFDRPPPAREEPLIEGEQPDIAAQAPPSPQPEAKRQGMPAGAAAPEKDEFGRWLEAITYALIALAGLAALGVLLLWAGLRERRRLTEAIEALATSKRI